MYFSSELVSIFVSSFCRLYRLCKLTCKSLPAAYLIYFLRSFCHGLARQSLHPRCIAWLYHTLRWQRRFPFRLCSHRGWFYFHWTVVFRFRFLMTTNYGTVEFKKCATGKISNFRLSGTELQRQKFTVILGIFLCLVWQFFCQNGTNCISTLHRILIVMAV